MRPIVRVQKVICLKMDALRNNEHAWKQVYVVGNKTRVNLHVGKGGRLDINYGAKKPVQYMINGADEKPKSYNSMYVEERMMPNGHIRLVAGPNGEPLKPTRVITDKDGNYVKSFFIFGEAQWISIIDYDPDTECFRLVRAMVDDSRYYQQVVINWRSLDTSRLNGNLETYLRKIVFDSNNMFPRMAAAAVNVSTNGSNGSPWYVSQNGYEQYPQLQPHVLAD